MATLEGADAYFAGTLREEDWNNYSDAQKKAAIKDASMMFERLRFEPAPPQSDLDNAIYEEALCLLEMTGDDKDTLRNVTLGLTSATVGKQSEAYGNAGASSAYVDGVFICPNAMAWVSEYMQKKPTAVSGRLLWNDRWCRR